MALTLIGAGPSPFVRKVRVLMAEAGIDDVVMETVVTGPMATPDLVSTANPLGKIPVLTRDDGPAIYDSRIITRYLDARAQAGFYPEKRLWEVLTLEATAEGIMEAGIAMTYEARVRPEAERSADWVEAQWAKAKRAIGVINDRWMSHLEGPLDMAQIATGCALGYMDFRHDARGWRNGNDALATWFARFSERDSMTSTFPADPK